MCGRIKNARKNGEFIGYISMTRAFIYDPYFQQQAKENGLIIRDIKGDLLFKKGLIILSTN